MKKIIALLVLILALPAVSAYAATTASRSFVVRNWKAATPEPTPAPSPSPAPTDEPTVSPELTPTPTASTTPAPTDDVEMVEPEETEEVEMLEPDVPEEQGEEPLADDEPLPADEEQAIPSVNEDADGQGETNEPDADEALPPEPTTDQVEQSKEPAMDDTPAEDGEEEITITTEEEPEDVGEARVDIGGSEAQRRARRPRRSRGRMVVASGTGAAEQYTPQIQKNQIPLRKTLSKFKIHIFGRSTWKNVLFLLVRPIFLNWRLPKLLKR